MQLIKMCSANLPTTKNTRITSQVLWIRILGVAEFNLKIQRSDSRLQEAEKLS